MKPTKEQLIEDRKIMTVKEMGEKYGISESTMRYHLKRYGLTKKVDRVDIDNTEIKSLYEKGYSINEIAMHFSASHDTITKRLHAMGIANNRADGIKRHFGKTYQTRWVDIKKDLDAGFSRTYVRGKYKIRIENLDMLMKEHGYYYGSDAYRKRLEARLEKAKQIAKKNGRKKQIVMYVEKLIAYYDTYGVIPTRKQFAKYIDVVYSNVCITVRNNDLESFFVHSYISSAELLVKAWLENNHVSYILHDRKILGGHELDFYLPKEKIGIEVNPYGFHQTGRKYPSGDERGEKDYHQQKALLAREKGIGLFHLYDMDFGRLDFFLSFLVSKPTKRIGARKCKAQEISGAKAFSFYEQYHLQGGVSTKGIRHVGLFDGEKLIAALSIAPNRYAKKFSYEIIRYAADWDYAISGGFLKMLFCFRKLGFSGTLGTYVNLDKRKRAENVYEKNGFTFVSVTEPGYVWTNGKETLSRYQTQKTKLIKQGYDKEKTEKEIMAMRGFAQVYLSGNLFYTFSL